MNVNSQKAEVTLGYDDYLEAFRCRNYRKDGACHLLDWVLGMGNLTYSGGP